jgi:heterodisulfide reductase subunit C
MGIDNIIFFIAISLGFGLFVRNSKRLSRAILQGKSIGEVDRKKERFLHMLRLAFGQQKMHKNLLVGVLHLVVYLGFIFINIELLEILFDGIFGTHRVLSFLGTTYDFAIAAFECFALSVIAAVVVFWIRRNLIHIARFRSAEMKGWPKLDANLILVIEVVLMLLFLTMNAADYALQLRNESHYPRAGLFPVSALLTPIFDSWSTPALILIERSAWWAHILGILGFLNYLYYSKHLHILLAFPNTFYAQLTPKGQFASNEVVTREVKAMLSMQESETTQEIERFGAKDVTDLSWLQLMNAYSCTECGRCTEACPANQTGKLLSPRKIMMDTRDRAEILTKSNLSAAIQEATLLDHYISREELWACTSCNACVETCPIEINPLSIIMKMREYIVMEEAAAPADLNAMMANIENNGAPWAFNAQDRMNWVND